MRGRRWSEKYQRVKWVGRYLLIQSLLAETENIGLAFYQAFTTNRACSQFHGLIIKYILPFRNNRVLYLLSERWRELRITEHAKATFGEVCDSVNNRLARHFHWVCVEGREWLALRGCMFHHECKIDPKQQPKQRRTPLHTGIFIHLRTLYFFLMRDWWWQEDVVRGCLTSGKGWLFYLYNTSTRTFQTTECIQLSFETASNVDLIVRYLEYWVGDFTWTTVSHPCVLIHSHW